MSVKRRSNTEWRELIAQCEASGLTQEEWCVAHGVKLNTMRDRARRLRQMDSRGSENRVSGKNARNHWVEVKEIGQKPDEEASEQPSNKGRHDEPRQSEIRISAGAFTVSVTDGFNETALARVLNVIMGLDGIHGEVAS